ncbi:MAG: TonB-dependent receptor plug domain-containing protein [Candidatus Marinarcus sp.]|uniref:TonB-dependent receptor plug domain-containing protein n=1 Tax=Candidatus Marinarcus sp. TaxID=3100987 RepID=UPI003AFFE7D1
MHKKITTSFVAALFLATTHSQADERVLSTITVTSATKSEQSIKDVTSNVSVITKEEIEERHYTSVVEALNSVSGIDFNSNGSIGSISNVYLRGMANNRVLVLVDGVRFQDPSNTSGANIAHLMITNIERIEIIKGAQSGIWGSEAAAGVINIITKKAEKGTHGSANLEYGSFNTKKYGASLSHGTEKFDVIFSANKITTDSYTTKAPRGKDIDNYEDDSYENRTINLKTNYYINEDAKLNFNMTDIDALKEYDSSDGNDTNMKSDIQSRLYSLAYLQKIKQHNFSVKYELSKFEREEIGSAFGVLKFNGETKNIELNDNYKYTEAGFLLMGAGSSKDDVDYIKVDTTKNQRKSENKYAYLTNSNNFDETVLTQSIRFDKYKNFDNKVTGKVGIKHAFNQDLSFSSNYGTAYNVPSIIQQLNPWGATNLDLEPETTKSFDMGFSYKDLSVTLFKSKVDNLIGWQGSGYANVTGESNFEGVEVEYSKEVISNVLLGLNYTRLRAQNADDQYLARRPNQTLKTSLDYYGLARFNFNVNAEYVGKRYDGANKTGAQTGKYTVWNAVVNYEINNNLSAYVKLDNITDKYYQTVDGYTTAPRSAYVGLKATF